MDLRRSTLKIKLRLTNALGQPVAKDANVGLVNLPLQAVFSQVDCSLQQTSVTQTGTNYPYKAYIDTLLETGDNDRVLRDSQLFEKDTPGHHDDDDALFTYAPCTWTKAASWNWKDPFTWMSLGRNV